MQAGYIASSYDIGGILTVLPVTFLCGRLNKSLVIGLSFILLGIGTIIYSLPHFLAEARLLFFLTVLILQLRSGAMIRIPSATIVNSQIKDRLL